jgi:thiosulfate/3-mercaptopyruvate sulfurtransferase
MRIMAAGLAGVLVLSAGCDTGERAPDADGRPVEDRVAHDMLVSTEWLAEHLEDPDVVVVHVAALPSEYETGHIPGARFLPLPSISMERDGLVGQLPAVEDLEVAFEGLGLGDATRVVFYGPPLAAARAFVAMDVLGLTDRAALLDGGLAMWQAEGRPLATGAAVHEPATLSTSPRPELIVDAYWVDARRTEDGVVLLDARPAAEYRGEVPGADVPRGGHIPGARNLFWQETIESEDEPRLRDVGTVQELFRNAGVEPGDVVVTYCRSGMQSSFLYFVARYLGYDTRLYDGSFLDWSRRDDLPVERPEPEPAEAGAG